MLKKNLIVISKSYYFFIIELYMTQNMTIFLARKLSNYFLNLEITKLIINSSSFLSIFFIQTRLVLLLTFFVFIN